MGEPALKPPRYFPVSPPPAARQPPNDTSIYWCWQCMSASPPRLIGTGSGPCLLACADFNHHKSEHTMCTCACDPCPAMYCFFTSQVYTVGEHNRKNTSFLRSQKTTHIQLVSIMTYCISYYNLIIYLFFFLEEDKKEKGCSRRMMPCTG